MTRFLVARQVGPDAYRTIAGLCDGYLEHTGAILLEHYNTPEKVDKLLDLGDIYYLGKELDPPPGMTFEEKQTSRNVTMAFCRDFGDPGDPAEVLSLKELESPEFRNEYVYIFTEANQWAYFSGTYDHGLLDLRDSVNRLMEAPPPKVVAAPQHRYYDTNQREIFADMYIQFPSGTVEKVYATQDADGDFHRNGKNQGSVAGGGSGPGPGEEAPGLHFPKLLSLHQSDPAEIGTDVCRRW